MIATPIASQFQALPRIVNAHLLTMWLSASLATWTMPGWRHPWRTIFDCHEALIDRGR